MIRIKNANKVQWFFRNKTKDKIINFTNFVAVKRRRDYNKQRKQSYVYVTCEKYSKAPMKLNNFHKVKL